MILNDVITNMFGPYVATMIGFALALMLIAHVLRKQRRQSASIAWLLAFILAPIIFVPAYLLFAGRKVASKAKGKRPLHSRGDHDRVSLEGLGADIEESIREYDMSAASDGNDIDLITSAEGGYEAFTEMIESAEESIWIATFILARDDIGRDIADRLARRARDGVKVYLLLDALGSLGARFTLANTVRRAGGQVGVFMPMLPLRRRWKADLRNHRKLAIFDGRIAISGGMNIGSDYIGPDPSEDRWIDTSVKIAGPAVSDLAGVFADDWEFATDERLDLPRETASSGRQIAQVVPSGPDVPHDALYDSIIASVYKARSRIWIVTPYFVPDSGLLRALVMQSRLGLDVCIVVPKSSDSLVADLARARFIRELHEAGARILVHPSRMVHAKQLIVDDALSMQGSANLDMRSLHLNYELALFCYDDETITETALWVEKLAAQCEAYSDDGPGVLRRIGEDVCWLAAPLL